MATAFHKAKAFSKAKAKALARKLASENQAEPVMHEPGLPTAPAIQDEGLVAMASMPGSGGLPHCSARPLAANAGDISDRFFKSMRQHNRFCSSYRSCWKPAKPRSLSTGLKLLGENSTREVRCQVSPVLKSSLPGPLTGPEVLVLD